MPRHLSGPKPEGNGEANQPLAKVTPEHTSIPTRRVFQIAEANCSEKEILGLAGVLDQRGQAREPHLYPGKTGVFPCGDRGCPLPLREVRAGRVRPVVVQSRPCSGSPFLRRFLTDQINYIRIAKNFVTVSDFHELSQRLVYPRESHGKLGGKGAGCIPGSEDRGEGGRRARNPRRR